MHELNAINENFDALERQLNLAKNSNPLTVGKYAITSIDESIKLLKSLVDVVSAQQDEIFSLKKQMEID